MKRTLTLILALVMLALSFTVPAPAAEDDEDYSKYDVSRYKAENAVFPMFWEGNVVVNECVYPIMTADGELEPFKLLYPATKILHVKNYSLRKDLYFLEHIDYYI